MQESHAFSLRRELVSKDPIKIVVAGQSKQRLFFVNELAKATCLPGTEVVSEEGGDEAFIHEVDEIAKNKLDHVTQNVVELRRGASLKKPLLVVAADVLNSPFVMNDSEEFVYESRGKPSSEDPQEAENEVMDTFNDMYWGARLLRRKHARYDITAGSASLTRTSNTVKEIGRQLEIVRVSLDLDAVKDLSGMAGYNAYAKECRRFYEEDLGQPELAVNPINISAGIDIAVLARMGVVTKIDGAGSDDSDLFPYKLKEAIYTAMFGYAPRVFDPTGINVERFIRQWPWLNNVVNKALQLSDLPTQI